MTCETWHFYDFVVSSFVKSSPDPLKLQEDRAFVCQAENNRVDHIKVASCSGETRSEYRAFECQAGTPLVPHFIQDNAE